MPRSARIDAPGAIHHVMVRGVAKQLIFLEDSDREDLVGRLETILPEEGAACYASALMPNHAHFLIRTGESSISRVMARLETGYALYFNRKYERVGHLFQNRYRSELVLDDAYLLTAIRYIHLNPIRAGLVRDLGALAWYPWTGHAALMGNAEAPFQDVSWVLSLFAEDVRTARVRLLAWMGEDPTSEQEGAMSGASSRHEPAPLRPADTTPTPRPFLGHDLDALAVVIDRVCADFGLSRRVLAGRSKSGEISDARAAIAFIACRSLGIRNQTVATALGLAPPSVSRARLRGRRVLRARPALGRIAEDLAGSASPRSHGEGNARM